MNYKLLLEKYIRHVLETEYTDCIDDNVIYSRRDFDPTITDEEWRELRLIAGYDHFPPIPQITVERVCPRCRARRMYVIRPPLHWIREEGPAKVSAGPHSTPCRECGHDLMIKLADSENPAP